MRIIASLGSPDAVSVSPGAAAASQPSFGQQQGPVPDGTLDSPDGTMGRHDFIGVGRQEDQPGSEFTREVRLSIYVKYPSFNLGVRALALARDLE